MLRRSTWKQKHFSENVFILSSLSTKMFGFPKSTYRKELPILKKWLIGRSLYRKKLLFWKSACCEKVTVLKKELLKKSWSSEKIAAPEK